MIDRHVSVGVLVSGTGTNLQALLDAEAKGALAPAAISVVLCNNPGAPAISRARAANKATHVVDHRGRQRAAFEAALLEALGSVDLVVLAGFMRVLTGHFLERFPRRVVNTHPSLLPAFPGLDAAGQAIAAGATTSGVTIHFVDTTVDGGPIIAQAQVPVLPDDTPAELHARIQVEEHKLLPRVVRDLATQISREPSRTGGK